MNDIEIWKPVPGYEDFYQVSNLGRVKSMNYGRRGRPGLLKPRLSGKKGNQYLSVALCVECCETEFKVHRLVMLAFVGVRPDGLETNHDDGNKLNNSFSNLEYVTHSENEKHKHRMGLVNRKGASNGHSKMTDEKVYEMFILRRNKMKLKDIAIHFGITEANASAILSRKTWRHLDIEQGVKNATEPRPKRINRTRPQQAEARAIRW